MTVYAYDGVSPTLPGEGRYWVAPTADVMGKVTLGEDVSIWFGAVLRGDNEPIVIGSRQQHPGTCDDPYRPGYPCTVGPNCTVGHRAILHGCTLGANTLIGMGAIVLNGAKIGDNCLIGAGALVAGGQGDPRQLPGPRHAGQGRPAGHRGPDRHDQARRRQLRQQVEALRRPSLEGR